MHTPVSLVTHSSHAGNVFVTGDLDLSPFCPEINKFPGLIVEDFCVMFGDRLLRYGEEKTARHTDKRR